MNSSSDYPYIVIGAGAGGLVVAIGLAKAGKKVLLIEKGNWGGDCTNFGCVPSKTLIAAAEVAHSIKNREEFGLKGEVKDLLADGALERTKNIVKSFIAKEDPGALNKHGVDTLVGTASFVDPQTLDITFSGGGKTKIKGKTIILATGSEPVPLAIEGLSEVPYLTNETIFSLPKIPKKLVVIGGGPIGTEMAHAFNRLGAKVTLIQHGPHLLMREEPESQVLLESITKKEGIDLLLEHETIKVSKKGEEISLTLKDHGKEEKKTISATHLLVAVGRKPVVETLKLQNAGIKDFDRGVQTDRYGRTEKNHIWAVGDVTGGPLFTHMAEAAGRRILFNLIMPRILWKKEPTPLTVPRVTYTNPEVAAIGLTEAEAIKKYGKKKITTYSLPFDEVDRAICAGQTEGLIKVITKKWSSQIVGASIVGPRAGEILMELAVAMQHRIPLRKLSDVIHPYPIYGRAVRKVADQWLTKTLLPTLKSWISRK